MHFHGAPYTYPDHKHGSRPGPDLFQGNCQTSQSAWIYSIRPRPKIYVCILEGTSSPAQHKAPHVHHVPPTNWWDVWKDDPINQPDPVCNRGARAIGLVGKDPTHWVCIKLVDKRFHWILSVQTELWLYSVNNCRYPCRYQIHRRQGLCTMYATLPRVSAWCTDRVVHQTNILCESTQERRTLLWGRGSCIFIHQELISAERACMQTSPKIHWPIQDQGSKLQDVQLHAWTPSGLECAPNVSCRSVTHTWAQWWQYISTLRCACVLWCR